MNSPEPDGSGLRFNPCRRRSALSADYGLALEEIARTLTHGAIAITGQERADIPALADRVDELAATDSTRVHPGVEAGINPDCHPWADATGGVREGR